MEAIIQPVKNLVPQVQAQAMTPGTYNGPDAVNKTAKGIKVFVFVNSVAASGTITVNVQGKDPGGSGTYVTLLASAALNSASTTAPTVMLIYPGAAVTTNVSANDVLPDTWRVQAVIATGTVQATISATLIY